MRAMQSCIRTQFSKASTESHPLYDVDSGWWPSSRISNEGSTSRSSVGVSRIGLFVCCANSAERSSHITSTRGRCFLWSPTSTPNARVHEARSIWSVLDGARGIAAPYSALCATSHQGKPIVARGRSSTALYLPARAIVIFEAFLALTRLSTRSPPMRRCLAKTRSSGVYPPASRPFTSLSFSCWRRGCAPHLP